MVRWVDCPGGDGGENQPLPLGPLVSNFVLHSPLRMARLTTTLDAISEGRVDLGLGMGGAPICRSASSVFERGATLADRFEDGLDSLIKVLDDEPLALAEVPMTGERSSPKSVRLSTPSVQVPRPPIVIGGHGPRMIDVAPRLGDRWNVYYRPGVDSAEDVDGALLRLIDAFEDRCALHGRSGKGSALGCLRRRAWLATSKQRRAG